MAEAVPIPGCTHVAGDRTGVVADGETIGDICVRRWETPEGLVVWSTWWRPTDDERAAIAAGRPLQLDMLSPSPMPVRLAVPPEADASG